MFSIVSHSQHYGVDIITAKSSRTGLTVRIAQVEGPLVNGFFTLATEAFDDDGLPHTLEHLIFLGSEEYPFKGVLDGVANRCLAQGTNAWTAVDHTSYTVSCAGAQGFLQLLPIYLDHVLYPTVTESGYITEVHHINGAGEDAGVVYCEMQGVENTGENIVERRLIDLLYPEGGYRSETGGKLKNLRESCSHAKVKAYHKEFYRADNLCLIVTGKLTPLQVFQAIASVEDKILRNGPLSPHVRPWISAVAPTKAHGTVETVAFPSDDVDGGLVMIGWRSFSWSDFLNRTAFEVINEYLTDSATMDYKEGAFTLVVENVSKENLPLIRPKVFEVLRNLANGAEPLDMDRMATVIQRIQLNTAKQAEESPENLFVTALVQDFLYAQDDTEVARFLDEPSRLKTISSWSAADWQDKINGWFAENKSITIIGEPSLELATHMQQEEKDRLELQKIDLGGEKMAALKSHVEEATELNNRTIPSEVMSAIPVPGIDSVNFHHVETLNVPANAVSFPIQFDHVKSQFVQLIVLLDTHSLSNELRPYLGLFQDLFFESPVRRGGILVSHEEVVAALDRDTLDRSFTVGCSGGSFSAGTFAQAAFMMVKADNSKYASAVCWISDLLMNVVFTPERVKVSAARILGAAAEFRRDGRSICATLIRNLDFGGSNDSNINHISVCVQQKFLTEIQHKLAVGSAADAEQICAHLEQLRATLAKGFCVHVAADVDLLGGLEHATNVWSACLRKSELKEPTVPWWTSEFLRSGGRAQIVGLGSVESGYLIVSVPGIRSFDHVDLPALLVAIEYLIALEGPLWRQLRGQGLTYGYNLQPSVEEGLLKFSLYRSGQLDKAFLQAKVIFEDFISGKTAIDPVALEGAVSGAMSGVIDRESTRISAATESFYHKLRRLTPGRTQRLLSAMKGCSLEDVRIMFKRYFSALFTPADANMAIVVNTSKVADIVAGMTPSGFALEVLPNVERAFGIDATFDEEIPIEDEEAENVDAESEDAEQSEN